MGELKEKVEGYKARDSELKQKVKALTAHAETHATSNDDAPNTAKLAIPGFDTDDCMSARIVPSYCVSRCRTSDDTVSDTSLPTGKSTLLGTGLDTGDHMYSMQQRVQSWTPQIVPRFTLL